jgi:GSH-dependent disulfide-bond oxidoreductase
MIDLYTWNTSNGRKASIMLEELVEAHKLPGGYTVHPINIGKDEQFSAEYKKINPNSKIPALVDSEGPGGAPITVFESGAMLIYLAEKFGAFMPSAPRARYEVLQWLMWQMGGVGPMFGQVHHYLRAAPEPVPYAIERYGKECRRLYGVLDARLQNRAFVVDEYSIADIAIFPWVARYDWQKVDLAAFANVKRWFDAIAARPAVKRGLNVPAV